MNKFFVLISLLAISCSPGSKVVQTEVVPFGYIPIPDTFVPGDEIDSVRIPETVKSYPVNPHVDSSGLRHDAHDVQRLEQSADWNLSPDYAGIIRGPQPHPIKEKIASPMLSEIEQELARQKQYTAATIEQNEQLSETIVTLKEQASINQQIVIENKVLKQQLKKYEDRLSAVESKASSSPPAKQRSWAEWWYGTEAIPLNSPSTLTHPTNNQEQPRN